MRFITDISPELLRRMRIRHLLHLAIISIAAFSGASCVARPSPTTHPAVHQQRSGLPERGEQIVLYSPHFDEAPPVRIAFDCPAAAVHLIGFEGARSIDSTARLLIRTLRHPNAWSEPFDAVLPEVMIRLVQRIGDPVAERLPLSPPWVLATDSSGYGQIIAPPGIYRVQFQRVGFRSGAGVLQLRPAVSDSLHVYMDAAAIC